jgi:hypothetical protein
MSDTDLIRRKDVTEILFDEGWYGNTLTRIDHLPAVQPAPVTVEAAARVLLNAPFADRDKAANAMLNWGLSPFTAADSLTAALRALAGEKPNE